MSSRARPPEFVQSLERGLAVIRAFSRERPALTLSEIADLTGLTRAAARRFLITLRDLGYVEGEHFVLEYRSADGQDQRFPGLASELARLKVDLILTRGTPAALAAKNATGAIPVVIIGVGDPVGQGLVASLAHPGANITG